MAVTSFQDLRLKDVDRVKGVGQITRHLAKYCAKMGETAAWNED